MTRTDIHSPKSIIPADYDFVGYSYLGPSWDDFEYSTNLRKVINDHMARTGGRYSQHEHGGSCHVCGASALYMAVFHHRPSNVYIKTGLDCADKMCMDHGNGDLFRKTVRLGLEAVAGKKKAFAFLQANGIDAAWSLYTAKNSETHKYEENTIVSIVANLIRWGSLSEKQVNFVRVLLGKIAERPAIEAARQTAYNAAADVPVSADRMLVEGEIVSSKWQDSPYGRVQKMLVVCNAGFKLWGSVPKGVQADRGTKVRFLARVERSNNDPKFGFYSRPTSATVL